MIQIDMPMPKRCLDCPCYSHAIYGHCKVKNHFFEADDRIWQEKRRPDWCPLKEVLDISIPKRFLYEQKKEGE